MKKTFTLILAIGLVFFFAFDSAAAHKKSSSKHTKSKASAKHEKTKSKAKTRSGSKTKSKSRHISSWGPVKPAKSETIEGLVTAIDTDAKTMVVTNKSGDKTTIVINKKTMIRDGMAKKSIEDIEADTTVTVVFTAVDSANAAYSINIESYRKQKEPAPVEKPSEIKPAPVEKPSAIKPESVKDQPKEPAIENPPSK